MNFLLCGQLIPPASQPKENLSFFNKWNGTLIIRKSVEACLILVRQQNLKYNPSPLRIHQARDRKSDKCYQEKKLRSIIWVQKQYSFGFEVVIGSEQEYARRFKQLKYGATQKKNIEFTTNPYLRHTPKSVTSRVVETKEYFVKIKLWYQHWSEREMKTNIFFWKTLEKLENG